MRISTRSPLFWTFLVIGFLGASFFSYHYFSKAFPIVSVDLLMDRAHAIEKAALLGSQYTIGPVSYHTAIDFDTDNNVKRYIELEAGGKEMLTELIQKHWYEIYVWRVRHFNEYNPHEATFFFSPEGVPYGFIEKISEELPGAALPQTDAQLIAEH